MHSNRVQRKLMLFIVPAMAAYLFFYIVPMFIGMYYSVTDWDGLSKTKNFVGLKNYQAILNDTQTLSAINNTLFYTLVVTSISLLIGLILALLLEKENKVNMVFRTIFFAPAILSPVVASYIWKYMYAPESGVINSIFGKIGLDCLIHDWLGDPKLALLAVMIVPLWQWGGNVMIVFLAGLINIPGEYYEAATIDGVSTWQRIRYITLPLLRPSMTFNVIISTIGSLKTFDFIFILTNGGPGYVTEMLTLRVYNYTLYTTNFGYGSAIAMLLTAFVVVFSLTELWLLTRNAD